VLSRGGGAKGCKGGGEGGKGCKRGGGAKAGPIIDIVTKQFILSRIIIDHVPLLTGRLKVNVERIAAPW
jgi:hypothetical protein